MDGLSDKPRSGAPRKLDESAVDRLVQWAKEKPSTAVELLQRHTEAQGTLVNTDTLIRTLKANGLVWKRTRHSLKKREMKPSSPSPARKSTS
jgi:transposase